MNFDISLDPEMKQHLVQDLGLPPNAHEEQIFHRLLRQEHEPRRVAAARELGLPETASWEDIEEERYCSSLTQRQLLRRARRWNRSVSRQSH